MNNEIAVRNQLTPDIWGMITSVATSMYDGRGQLGIVKQGEAAIKVLFCYENNLPFTAAVTGLYIINQRLSVMSNIIAAKIKQHPDYDYDIERLDNTGCVINILFDGNVVGQSSFLEDDAKQAKLLSKDNWKNYPRNCYFGRAITNAYRWYAPDIFSQPLYIPEELGATIDETGAPVIEGIYEVGEETKPITLQDLAARYDGAEFVAEACGKLFSDGMISAIMPSNQDDLKAVAEFLNFNYGDEND